jgi:dCMP deaminase
MTKPSWDDTFIELCYTIAERSKDRSTKVGCVIVGPNRELRSMGYNGMPRDVDDDVERRHQRPQKYLYMEHGERNAIYNAARMGTSLDGCSLYVLGPPCARCTRAIIQSGIKEVICASPLAPSSHEENCEASMEMLKEAEIMVRLPNSEEEIESWEYINASGWGDLRCRPKS